MLGQVEADLGVGEEADQELVAMVRLTTQLVVAATQGLHVPGEKEIVPGSQCLLTAAPHHRAEVPPLNMLTD